MGSNLSCIFSATTWSTPRNEEIREISEEYISAQELVPANSGAIEFEVKSRTGAAQLHLLNIHHRVVYTINLCKRSRINIYTENRSFDAIYYRTEYIKLKRQYKEFWVSWFKSKIFVGHGYSSVPFIDYHSPYREPEIIRYIIFDKGNNSTTKWKYEMPPNVFETPLPVEITCGELRWVSIIDYVFPPDALIGGFENEPIYIISAPHYGFMCPGKYVPSKGLAFIPWGGSSHVAYDYKVLCGYNAAWVQTSGNKIPENAIVAGTSQLGEESVFIGRAVHEGHLINGKVHVLQAKCYIPYLGEEKEYVNYEIMVLPNAGP